MPKVTTEEHKFLPGSLTPGPVHLTVRLYCLSLFRNSKVNKIQHSTVSLPMRFSEPFTHSSSFLPTFTVTQNKGAWGG